MCLCETKYLGGIAPFWGAANLPEKVSHNMGYRSDSIAISRDMGATKIISNRELTASRTVPLNLLAPNKSHLISSHDPAA